MNKEEEANGEIHLLKAMEWIKKRGNEEEYQRIMNWYRKEIIEQL